MLNSVRHLVLSSGGAACKAATAKYSKDVAEVYVAVIFKGMD